MTNGLWKDDEMYIFLLTCLLRGMTDSSITYPATVGISTHMPLARHDVNQVIKQVQKTISTHMPLARHDCFGYTGNRGRAISTHMPLARHDQNSGSHTRTSVSYFYSHASCEAWHRDRRWRHESRISTHMPLARHDLWLPAVFPATSRFLLTCLLRGMTVCFFKPWRIGAISTHMPLARHDER